MCCRCQDLEGVAGCGSCSRLGFPHRSCCQASEHPLFPPKLILSPCWLRRVVQLAGQPGPRCWQDSAGSAWSLEDGGEKEAATRQTPKSLLLGVGSGPLEGWARGPHCTACSLALLPESWGFMTSGSSGGLEKGSMRRASKASSARKASPTVAGACGRAV